MAGNESALVFHCAAVLVLSVGDGFDMRRVTTGFYFTQMVRFQPFGNRPLN
jgi:hypothetical protein